MNKRIPTFNDFEFKSYTRLYELSHNSTLYHRSRKKLEVGETIQPYRLDDGRHHLENNTMELALEEYRKENFPGRPSRFKCVYSSVIPRSRFTDYGDLYIVKPIGKMFMTDSMLIDKLNEASFQMQKELSWGFYQSKNF